VNARSYLSIGQVLDLLKREFPDLTISKIRFLESQGLLDPERTPSGYRKFYDPDVERLRYILKAQQEQYLPLKVIKGRLGPDEDGDEEAAEGERVADGPRGANGSPVEVDRGTSRHPSVVPATRTAVAPPVVGAPAAAAPAARGAGPTPMGRSTGGQVPAAGEPAPGSIRALTPWPANRPREAAAGEVSLTLEELAEASGMTPADVSELERFGLLTGRRLAGTTYYDADCATIAAVAARFRAFGVEARHLRMYRTAVEREASFFEQVVTPMLKQRNPQARRQAVDTLLEMSRLGSAMREAVLRQALGEYTGGS
jgi:DNA-binding transcriptional MerR regulator